MRRRLVPLLLALVATGALVAGGLALTGRDAPQRDDGDAAKPFHTTPLSAVDTTTMSFRRSSFCSRVDPRQVTAALGAKAASQRTWNDGDRTDLSGRLTDVAHEFGCAYDATDGAAATAWVFAPPVGAAQAAALVRSTGRTKGCTTLPTSPAFGRPSLGLTCAAPDGTARASYRGLFGDAWVTCEVTVPAARPSTPAELADRAGRWCVGVLRSGQAPT